MSKALLQFRDGLSLKVGGCRYEEIAGEFEEINGEIVLDTFFGPAIFFKTDFIMRLPLHEDFDMSTLDPSEVLVVN